MVVYCIKTFNRGDTSLILDRYLPKDTVISHKRTADKFRILEEPVKTGNFYAYKVTDDYYLSEYIKCTAGDLFNIESCPDPPKITYLLRLSWPNGSIKRVESHKTLEEIVELYTPVTVFSEDMEILFDRTPMEEDFLPLFKTLS